MGVREQEPARALAVGAAKAMPERASREEQMFSIRLRAFLRGLWPCLAGFLLAQSLASGLLFPLVGAWVALLTAYLGCVFAAMARERMDGRPAAPPEAFEKGGWMLLRLAAVLGLYCLLVQRVGNALLGAAPTLALLVLVAGSILGLIFGINLLAALARHGFLAALAEAAKVTAHGWELNVLLLGSGAAMSLVLLALQLLVDKAVLLLLSLAAFNFLVLLGVSGSLVMQRLREDVAGAWRAERAFAPEGLTGRTFGAGHGPHEREHRGQHGQGQQAGGQEHAVHAQPGVHAAGQQRSHGLAQAQQGAVHGHVPGAVTARGHAVEERGHARQGQALGQAEKGHGQEQEPLVADERSEREACDIK